MRRYLCFCFFFSSRRRHTRWTCDWSSDVCSSDLLPLRLRHGDDPRLAALPWGNAPALEVSRGPSDGHDLAAVSHAFAAVAETGTVVLTSGPDNPTTLNFLPDVHVVVVEAGAVAGDFETVMEELRDRYGVGTLPRTVNM